MIKNLLIKVLVGVAVVSGMAWLVEFRRAQRPASVAPPAADGLRRFPGPTSTDGWEAHRDDEYGFSVMHPPRLDAVSKRLSELLFVERSTVVDIGTPEHLASMKRLEESGVANEGMPQYLHLGVSVPKEPERERLLSALQEGKCGEGEEGLKFVGFADMDGVRAVVCEGSSWSGRPALTLLFSRDGVAFFRVRSEFYAGDEKQEIQHILSMFAFAG